MVNVWLSISWLNFSHSLPSQYVASSMLPHRCRVGQAQIKEDNQIFVDFEEMTATTIHESSEKFKIVKLDKYQHSIRSVLKYLADQELIENNESGLVKVLHPGWRIVQTDVSAFFKFLSNSVLVPIGVSIATTIVLGLLEGIIR